MKDCVLQAEFADYKRIKTRKVMQLIFEIPIEQAIATLNLLGEPSAGDKQITCAIAKLDLDAAADDAERESGMISKAYSKANEAEPEKPKKSLTLSQKCALRCNQELFWRFMESKYDHNVAGVLPQITTAPQCAISVRSFLDIGSRSELDRDPLAAERWSILHAEFEFWKTE